MEMSWAIEDQVWLLFRPLTLMTYRQEYPRLATVRATRLGMQRMKTRRVGCFECPKTVESEREREPL